MAYRREIPLSVSIDITLKDKDVSTSQVLDFMDIKSVEPIFRLCLSVLLEQDAYRQDEIKEATRIISELTNHEEGFNITSKDIG
tara:strand:- start:196 stop:447 length:252 start_codon:yes stop_codon:yes gene_type:complete